MIINELVTKLSFKQDKGLAAYERSMQAAKRSTERAAAGMERSMRGANKTINNLLKFNVQVKTDKAHMQIKSLENAFSGLKNVAMAGFGAAGLDAAGAGVVGKQIFDVGKEYESLSAALVTVTKSQSEANKQFDRLEKFAKTTPYDLNQVVRGFITLKSLNLDTSDYALTQLGNIAGARSISLNQVIEAVSDAATFDFERVKEAFKITYENDAQAGVVRFTDPTTKMTTVVKRNAQDIQKYLLGLGDNFKGGMARQAATIGGMTSNLSDNFQALGRAIWTGGFGDAAKSVVKWLTDFTEKIQPIVEKQVPIFIKDMKKLAIDVFPKILPLAEGITAALVGMGGAYAYLKILAVVDFMGKLVLAWRAMDGAMKAAAISGAIANLTIAWMPALIAAVVGAVAWFGWQVYKYITQGTDSLTWMNENFKWVADSIMFVGELIKTWWPIIEYTAKVIAGVLILAFQGLWEIIKFGWDTIVKPKFDAFVQSLTDIWNWVKSVTVENENWTAGVTILWDAWKGFLNWIQPVLQWVGDKLGGIGNAARDLINTLASVPGFSGGGETQPTGGAGAAGLAATAINFVKSGQADKFAFSMGKSNGFVTKSLFQMGIACAQTVDQLLKMSGASKEVQDAMTASAPGSYSNLKGRGLAKGVSEKDLMPGDLVFYNPGGKGIQHVGVYVGNGQIVDASNSAGKQIGTGQRVIQRKNWMQGQAQYLRINANQFSGQGSVVVNNNVNLHGSNATPQKVQKAVEKGTGKALTNAAQQNRKIAPAGGT